MVLHPVKAVLISLLLSLSLMTSSYASVEKATAWLVQQQDSTTGEFVNKDWLRGGYVLTLKAMNVLAKGFLSSHAINQGFHHLHQYPAEELDTEMLAQRIQLGHRYGRAKQHDIDALLARKNKDGSFGINPFNGTPDVFSTVSAVMALMPVMTVSFDNSIAYLVSEQSTTGGWELPESSLVGSYFQTVLAVNTLQANQDRYVLNNTLAKAREYLAENLNEELIKPSILAQGLLHLLENAESIHGYETLIDSLNARQQANGSFDNDTYLTAVMVQVLNRVQQLNAQT